MTFAMQQMQDVQQATEQQTAVPEQTVKFGLSEDFIVFAGIFYINRVGLLKYMAKNN
jgi:hypothetical protein